MMRNEILTNPATMPRFSCTVFLLITPALLTAGAALWLALDTALALVLMALACWIPVLVYLQARARTAQLQAQRSQAFMQRLIDVIPQPVYVKDADSRYVMINRAFAAERGMTVDALTGMSSFALSPSPEVSEKIATEDRAVLDGQDIYTELNEPRNGQDRYRIIMKGRCLDSDARPVIVGANFDITPWRTAEIRLEQALKELQAHQQRTQGFIQTLLDLIPDPTYIKDRNSRFLMVNDAFASERHLSKASLIGLSSQDIARSPEEAQISLQEDRQVLEGAEIMKEQHTTLPGTTEECYRVIFKRRGLDIYEQPIIFGLNHYITRWKMAAIELEQQAFLDPLTGIANRRHFRTQAGILIDQSSRSHTPLTIALLDIDHFKQVNDRYGHPVGDEVLIETVRRCQSCLRRSDTIGRWGGEEFVLLLAQSEVQEALLITERLRHAIADTPFITSAGALHLTLSGGLTELRAGLSLDELINQADQALYQAKQNGRNRISLHA